MADKGFKTYILYKENEGWELARLVYESLRKNRFLVELDTKDRPAVFDEKLFNSQIKPKIDDSDIIIILLSRKALDGYIKNKKDFFVSEIAYVLDLVKNNDQKAIIPLVDNSTFDTETITKLSLPKEFQSINDWQTIFMNEKFYVNSMQNLFNLIVDKEFNILKRRVNRWNPNKRINTPKYLKKNIDKKVTSFKEVQDEVKLIKQNEELNRTLFAQEKEIYKDIFAQYRHLNVLDLGCGNCSFIGLLFDDPNIKLDHYLGVDIDPYQIDVAKEYLKQTYGGMTNKAGEFITTKFDFIKHDLLDTDVQNNPILAWCEEHGKNGKPLKFDVIIIRNVLRDFKDPSLIIELSNDLLSVRHKTKFDEYYETHKFKNNGDKTSAVLTEEARQKMIEDALKNIAEGNNDGTFDQNQINRIREYLANIAHQSTNNLRKYINKFEKWNDKAINGTVIITDIDDGFDLFYPDKDGLIRHFYNLLDKCSNAGNRYTGREIYTHLIEANFVNPQLHNLVDSTYNSEVKEFNLKEFELTYNDLIQEYEQLKANNPNDRDACLELDWLLNNKKRIFELLKKDDFFLVNSKMIWTARK